MKFRALQDLPFGIRKGDELDFTSDNPRGGTLRFRKANGTLIPGINPIRETEFFEEVVSAPEGVPTPEAVSAFPETNYLPVGKEFMDRFPDVVFTTTGRTQRGYEYLNAFVPDKYTVGEQGDTGHFTEWDLGMNCANAMRCWAGYIDDKVKVAGGTKYYIRGTLD